MPTYMRDTNMCIYLMKDQPPQVALRLAECHEGEVVLSAITLAELEYGVTVSAEPWRARVALRALVARVPVVTNNVRDFEAYPGIRIEDWTRPVFLYN